MSVFLLPQQTASPVKRHALVCCLRSGPWLTKLPMGGSRAQLLRKEVLRGDRLSATGDIPGSAEFRTLVSSPKGSSELLTVDPVIAK